MRLYDPKSQRRPVINVEVKDAALTTLTVVPQKRYIYIYIMYIKKCNVYFLMDIIYKYKKLII